MHRERHQCDTRAGNHWSHSDDTSQRQLLDCVSHGLCHQIEVVVKGQISAVAMLEIATLNRFSSSTSTIEDKSKIIRTYIC